MASFGLGAPLATVTDAIDESTPWVAAADGNLQLLQQSLQILNLSVNAADISQHYTILQAAASYSQMNVIQWLLSQNVDVNAVDRDGDSALHYSSTARAAQQLVAAGINIHLSNQAGHTALEAKKLEYKELMEDPDSEDDDVDVVQLKENIDYLSTLQV